MSADEVDAWLAALPEPKRSTLEALRRAILKVAPTAEQGLSYGVPVFREGGKAIAGFSAAKAHLSYLPHSGDLLATLADELEGYEASKGALRFDVDKPLPARLVKRLIEERRAEGRQTAKTQGRKAR